MVTVIIRMLMCEWLKDVPEKIANGASEVRHDMRTVMSCQVLVKDIAKVLLLNNLAISDFSLLGPWEYES